MLVKQRQDLILNMLKEEGYLEVKFLLKKLNISSMTLWRDLRELEQNGIVKRVRGGICLDSPDPAAEAARYRESAFSEKKGVQVMVKSRIAEKAAEELTGSGDVIILEGGTTVAGMLPFLSGSGITVLTNSLEVAYAKAELNAGFELLCSGGILRDVSKTLVGPAAVEFFTKHPSRTLFLSGTAISEEGILMDPNPLELQVKQAMMENAERVVVLVDSSKIGQKSLLEVAGPDQIDLLVTDPDASPEFISRLEKAGVEVLLSH